jgi:hypothetical protein
MRLGIALVLIFYFAGCAKSVPHDEVLAAKRALEFAEAVFVKRDIEGAYARLSDKTQRYVSIQQIQSMLSLSHLKGYPIKVRATEYEFIPSENNALYIFVVGENSTEQFTYRLMMERTTSSDYRVLQFDREYHYSESPLRKSFSTGSN